MTTQTRKKLLRLTMGAAMVLSGAAALATEPPAATLRYTVSIGDMNLGEASLRYGPEANSFEARMETFANARVLLFAGGNATTTMKYAVKNGRLLLESITEKSSKGERKVVVDWKRRTITTPEDDPLPMKQGFEIENLSFPASLLVRPLDGVAGTKLQVVSPNRVREFVYEKPVRETIETPAGRFDTWRLRKKRLDGKPEVVTVWLTRDAARIPVRMERLKRERLTKFLLIRKEK